MCWWCPFTWFFAAGAGLLACGCAGAAPLLGLFAAGACLLACGCAGATPLPDLVFLGLGGLTTGLIGTVFLFNVAALICKGGIRVLA